MDSTLRIVDALTHDPRGRVTAQKISQLTRGFDRDQGEGFRTMYGVHGVDANPKIRSAREAFIALQEAM